MADNVGIATGADATVRTEEKGGFHSQVMVVDVGGAGAESLLSSTNGMPLADAPAATTGGPTTTASTTLFTIDTTGYQSVSCQLSGGWSGGVQFLTSNDGTNYFPLIGRALGVDDAETDTMFANGIMRAPAMGRYVRAVTGPLFAAQGGLGVSWSVYLRQQPVVLSDSIAVTADPAIPLPVGGKDVTGMSRMLLTGADGGLRLTDGPAPIVLSYSATTGAGSNYILDTLGYQSVSIQPAAAAMFNATITVECSNDGTNWGGVTGVGANGTALGIATNIGSAGVVYVFPVFSRYLRLRASGLTLVGSRITVYLRSTPAPWSAGQIPWGGGVNAPINLAQVAGGATPTGNGTAASVMRVSVASDNTAFSIIPRAAATGNGLLPFRIVTGTTGFIKASAGALYELEVYNVNAAVRYLHLYNKASAPTLSTDTPVITIPLPPTSGRSVPLSASIGLPFATGIAWAYTTDNIAIPATAATSAEGFFSGCYI